MLLHVVVAARPVELEHCAAEIDRGLEIVANLAFHALHVHHGDRLQPAAVCGLAAALWVEHGVVEDGVGPPLLGAHEGDLDVEPDPIRVPLVRWG